MPGKIEPNAPTTQHVVEATMRALEIMTGQEFRLDLEFVTIAAAWHLAGCPAAGPSK